MNVDVLYDTIVRMHLWALWLAVTWARYEEGLEGL